MPIAWVHHYTSFIYESKLGFMVTDRWMEALLPNVLFTSFAVDNKSPLPIIHVIVGWSGSGYLKFNSTIQSMDF